MINLRKTSKSALPAFLVFGITSANALAGDLSKYRNFHLGTELPAIAKQAGVSPSQVKVIHSRPALIQELEWSPQTSFSSAETEPVKDVVFTFYNGQLSQIVVNYDRYRTEGLTSDDLVEAISATYGIAERPAAPAMVTGRYGDQEEILARWQDSEHRFELIRSSFGPSFRLLAVVKPLEDRVHAAILEANRLDDQEAPQRDAARLATEQKAVNAKLEKARLVNKPKFRP